MLITVFFVLQSDYRGEDEWHGEQLCGQVETQLRAELEESQKQLKCAQDTQQEQKNKVQSLRYMKHTTCHTNILSGNTTDYW